MAPIARHSRDPLTFDDFEIGDEFLTAKRTVTEADVAAFAGISGDFNPLHTDRLHANTTPFGQRIAHGLLVLSIASGLHSRLGVTDGTTLAFLGIQEWNFRKPVFFGDTIYVRATITDKRETSKPDRGILTRRMEVLNQDDELVQEGLVKIMVVRRDREVDDS